MPGKATKQPQPDRKKAKQEPKHVTLKEGETPAQLDVPKTTKNVCACVLYHGMIVARVLKTMIQRTIGHNRAK